MQDYIELHHRSITTTYTPEWREAREYLPIDIAKLPTRQQRREAYRQRRKYHNVITLTGVAATIPYKG